MAAEQVRAPRLLESDWPRALFFRISEGVAAHRGYSREDYNALFARLDGIIGKALDEEVVGRSATNIDYFREFKLANPFQIVLLHFNADARDPRFQTGEYFAGHWIYHNGCKITQDITASQTVIPLEDASLFRTSVGRYSDRNEDIGLCELDSNGRPDWHNAEQVRLLSVNTAANRICVKRGAFETEARPFRANASYAAAHVGEGPWGVRNNLLWCYNFARGAPTDAQGLSAADLLVEDFTGWFGPQGELSCFDGVEFDLMYFYRWGEYDPGRGGRGPDVDADGRPDWGLVDGVNAYGLGVIDFCKKLREALGPERLILGDGHSPNHQRAFGLLNGIESEGWPSLEDIEVQDWSGGINRHLFWNSNCHSPAFSYFNHKYTESSDGQAASTFNITRLVAAAALLTESAFTNTIMPAAENDERDVGVWDEMRKGAERKPRWLGQPLAETQLLAKELPDLLNGEGSEIGPQLLSRFRSSNATASIDNGRLRIQGASGDVGTMRFMLQDVPCDGPDLTVYATLSCEPWTSYPAEMPRLLRGGIAPPKTHLISREPPNVGIRLRRGEVQPIDPETRALFQYRPTAHINSVAKEAYFTHPPYGHGLRGQIFWERTLVIPPDSRIRFFTGIGDRAVNSDGATFIVEIAEKGRAFRRVFRRHQTQLDWVERSVELSAYGGKECTLRFVADPGKRDNSVQDWAYWAEVNVLPHSGGSTFTQPISFMTFVNGHDFESVFYFNHVRTDSVDLEFEIEGYAPMYLSRIAAHAGPDVRFREYEHGVVVANPSRSPVEFSLLGRFPSSRFRFLKASPHQDGVVNTGLPTGEQVIVGAKDGIFLVKEPLPSLKRLECCE